MITLNEKIKNLYITWLKEQKCFVPISTMNPRKVRWTLWELNAIQVTHHKSTQNDCLGVGSNESFMKCFQKVDFLGNAKEWISTGCIFEASTEKYHTQELFFHIYNSLDAKERKVFLSMCTRLFTAGSIMDFTSNYPEIFKEWINTPPAGYAGMMSHEDISKFFKVFESRYSNNESKEDILYKYLDMRRNRMFKRIESQQILRNYVDNLIVNKERFDEFLTKLANTEFFKSSGKVVSFNVDKVGFYNEVNPSGKPIDKYKMTEIILALSEYINGPNEMERKRLFLNQFIMLNKDLKFDYYTLVFDSFQDCPEIDYRDFFKKVLPSCIEFINNPNLHHKGFNAAITKYFMEKRIPAKAGEEKIKRTKI